MRLQKIMMKTGDYCLPAKHRLNKTLVFSNSILVGLDGGTVTKKFVVV